MSISITCEWLEKASRDIRMAELAISEELYDEAAFHCQQAAEKALKALLVAYRIKPPKTHSLERLLVLLRDRVDVAWAYEEDLPALTYYAVEARYPGPPVSEEEALAALRLARKTLEWVKVRLEEIGIRC